VLCDEVVGRSNFAANVVWRSTDNSNNDAKQFSGDHNAILVYTKSTDWLSNRVAPSDLQTRHYKNPDNDPKGRYFDGNPLSSPNHRQNLVYDVVTPCGNVIEAPKNGWRWSKSTMESMMQSGEVRFNPDETGIRRRTYLADRKGLPPSTLWSALDVTGHNRQAKYEQRKLFPDRSKEDWFATPKPERLIRRVLEIATNPGDLVLDSFAGSGTTGAVAQKMGRRWIMVELGDHCFTHIVPRLTKVIDGEDAGGVTDELGWRGGGGFRLYRLAPSLLEKDGWGNWVVSKQHNPAMLAEAMCKLEGFRYAPHPEQFWMHGKSTETDFIYITTQNLNRDQVQFISDQVGDERTLLICCSAFRARNDEFPNLTLKKIPQVVLDRCEWGRDDYSLNVQELPPVRAIEDADDRGTHTAPSAMQELTLFPDSGDGDDGE
jgi:adenine-specific DNA-methyltransferase